MKCLTVDEANAYLSEVGMKVGEWNQIVDIGSQSKKSDWLNYRAPKDQLLKFSQHVAGWLPEGSWKMLQIDHSTGWIDPVQASLLGGLLFGAEALRDMNSTENRNFFFEFGKERYFDDNQELLISNLIYVLLLFESHAYVVSSKGTAGQRLGIQDGYVYFSSRDRSDILKAEALIKKFENNPSASPKWVSEIVAAHQERFDR